MKSTEPLDERIHGILSTRPRKTIRSDHLIPSAVLVPLFNKEGEYHVLLTKRTHKVNVHKGEISFPGGAYDPRDDNLERTALRESFEEIGLQEEDVQILGRLDDVETLTGYMICPFVGTFPYPYTFVRNREEIEEIVDIVLDVLLRKDRFDRKTIALAGQERIIYIYRCGPHVIWGATAKILKQFADLIRGGQREGGI